MISRNKAKEILRDTDYVLRAVSPNRRAYSEGVFMPVYFAVGPTRWIPYGDGDTVDGYIAPVHDIEYPDLIGRGIGYPREVQLYVPSRRTANA